MSINNIDFPSLDLPSCTIFWNYRMTREEELEMLDAEEATYKAAVSTLIKKKILFK